MIKKISLLVLVFIFPLDATVGQVKASGFPGHLDEFCRTAEYIVVAECLERTETANGQAARLKVEEVHKSPEINPKPEFLDVNGFSTSATRFYFAEGKRFFAFVFKDGRCDQQGSHIKVARDGGLEDHVHGFTTGELICLEENTDTLEKLTRQVKHVLSGEYERELLARISNNEMSYEARRTGALALCRLNPESAVEPVANLLLEISRQRVVNGPSRDVYMKLLALDSNRARDLSLQILSNTDSFVLYFEAAELLAAPQFKLDDFPKHYATLITAAQKWKESNPNTGYARMLPVFVNNDCRTLEVKSMLLAELASPEIPYFDIVSQATMKLQFPESLPLFWKQIKTSRQVSDLVNLDIYIARQVGAARVYDHEKFERLEVWMGQNLIRRVFPEYTKSLAKAEVIRVNKSLLFLIPLDDGTRQTCLYVGFARKEQKAFEHKVFVLFGE
jgi:hypothetical protein